MRICYKNTLLFSSKKSKNTSYGKFLTNVLVGDLLQVEVLRPEISGVERVSTEMSGVCTTSSLLGLGGLCTRGCRLDTLRNLSLPGCAPSSSPVRSHSSLWSQCPDWSPVPPAGRCSYEKISCWRCWGWASYWSSSSRGPCGLFGWNKFLFTKWKCKPPKLALNSGKGGGWWRRFSSAWSLPYLEDDILNFSPLDLDSRPVIAVPGSRGGDVGGQGHRGHWGRQWWLRCGDC